MVRRLLPVVAAFAQFLVGCELSGIVFVSAENALPSGQQEQCETSPEGEVTCYVDPHIVDSDGDEGNEDECFDDNDKCEEWATLGECIHSAGFMLNACRKSCGFCSGSEEIDASTVEQCEDLSEECVQFAENNQCDENPGFMLTQCKLSCGCCVTDSSDFGAPQLIPDEGEIAKMATFVTGESIKYMKEIRNDIASANIRMCENKSELCSIWASEGECKNNSRFMNGVCAPACQKCYLLELHRRCPMDPDAIDALEPGDLDRLFESILDSDSEYAKYSPKVLSRPLKDGDDEVPVDAEYIEGPWLVTFDNFVSEEEIDRLIYWGGVQGYARSADVGQAKHDGTRSNRVSDTRTSGNAWCGGSCKADPAVDNVMNRIANVTRSPIRNSEDIQLLKYEPGQYYKEHHDYIEHHLDRPCGVRTLTVFLYLNDVEEGGGTGFPYLDITVQPKKGSAVLWPSVLNEDPNKKDDRTAHEAQVVMKGVKYGANVWVHMRDFQAALETNCN